MKFCYLFLMHPSFELLLVFNCRKTSYPAASTPPRPPPARDTSSGPAPASGPVRGRKPATASSLLQQGQPHLLQFQQVDQERERTHHLLQHQPTTPGQVHHLQQRTPGQVQEVSMLQGQHQHQVKLMLVLRGRGRPQANLLCISQPVATIECVALNYALCLELCLLGMLAICVICSELCFHLNN